MGVLSWIAGPGGWIGDAIKTALTGPVVQGAVDAYKSKLAAGNTHEKLAADLAGRELALEQRERELAVQQNIADEGRWWTAAPRAVVQWSLAIYVAKVVIWDNVLGLGTTPDVKSVLIAGAFNAIIVMWFGGRTAEKVARIIGGKWGK
jgi:hypothetical protein